MNKSLFLTTENKVIKFVQSHAKYFQDGFRLPDGCYGGFYALNYGKKIYHSNDTRELVILICKDLGINIEE